MGFTFSEKNLLELEICGRKYMLDVFSRNILEAFEEHDKALSGLDSENLTPEVIEEACAAAGHFLNKALDDESAYRNIFEGRQTTYFDHLDVVKYLVEEISKFRASKMFRYMGLPDPTQSEQASQ